MTQDVALAWLLSQHGLSGSSSSPCVSAARLRKRLSTGVVLLSVAVCTATVGAFLVPRRGDSACTGPCWADARMARVHYGVTSM